MQSALGASEEKSVYAECTHVVVYGYLALGDYAETCAVYMFGKSRSLGYLPSIIGCEPEKQKEALLRMKRFSGLNKPSRMVLWVRVPVGVVNEFWSTLRDHLRGNKQVERPNGKPRPLITQHCRVGDNWYAPQRMGPSDFAEWCEEVAIEEMRCLGVTTAHFVRSPNDGNRR